MKFSRLSAGAAALETSLSLSGPVRSSKASESPIRRRLVKLEIGRAPQLRREHELWSKVRADQSRE